MKYTAAFLVLLIFCTGAKAQTATPKFSDAIEYNDYIIGQQDAVADAIKELMSVVNDSSSTRELCKAQLAKSLEKVMLCRDNIKALPGWQGDNSFRDTALLLFNFYVRSFEGPYTELIDLMWTDPFTEEISRKMNQIGADVAAEEAVYDNWFFSCQERFAIKNGFSLEE